MLDHKVIATISKEHQKTWYWNFPTVSQPASWTDLSQDLIPVDLERPTGHQPWHLGPAQARCHARCYVVEPSRQLVAEEFCQF